jgi:hypothetical protein
VSAVAEVERLTRLRDAAVKASVERSELSYQLVRAPRRLYEVEWGKRNRR